MNNGFVKKQGLREGAAVLLLATVLVKLIGALFKIPLSSNYVLGDLGFGYFSSAYDLYIPICTLAISGIPVAISRIVADFAAQNRWQDVKSAVRISKRFFCGLGLVFSVLMLILVFPFVKLTDKTGQSIYSMLAVVPTVLICFWVSVWRGYFEGLHNMTLTALSNVIEALGKLVLGLGFALITLKITENSAYAASAAIMGIAVGMFLSGLFLRISYKRYNDPCSNSVLQGGESYSKKEIAKIITAVSVPVILSSLSGSIVSLIDALTVRWQLSNEVANNVEVFKEMYSAAMGEYKTLSNSALSLLELPTFLYGIRSKAYTLYNLIPTLTVTLGISAIPVLTENYSNGKKEAVKENASAVLKLSALISFPAAAGFVSLGGRIMSLLYGEGASAQIGGTMLCIYGVAVMFTGVLIPLGCVLQALKKQNAALRNVAVGVVVKVVLNLVLCGNLKINIFGAAIATLFFSIVILCLHFITLLRSINGSLVFKTIFLKPFAAAVCCGITAKLVSLLGQASIITAVSILAAAVVYLAVLSLLNTFCEEDILGLPKGEKLVKVFKKFKILR